MRRTLRGATQRNPTHSRAYQQHIQESLNNTCPECRGTLHLWQNQYADHDGRPALQQHVRCLHCNLAYTRILLIPLPNPLWQSLAGLAQLVFTSARVQAVRAAQALKLNG